MVLAAAIVLGMFIYGAAWILGDAVQDQQTTVRYVCFSSDSSEIKPVMIPKPKTRKGK